MSTAIQLLSDKKVLKFRTRKSKRLVKMSERWCKYLAWPSRLVRRKRYAHQIANFHFQKCRISFSKRRLNIKVESKKRLRFSVFEPRKVDSNSVRWMTTKSIFKGPAASNPSVFVSPVYGLGEKGRDPGNRVLNNSVPCSTSARLRQKGRAESLRAFQKSGSACQGPGEGGPLLPHARKIAGNAQSSFYGR
jgi:hypothetical protein